MRKRLCFTLWFLLSVLLKGCAGNPSLAEPSPTSSNTPTNPPLIATDLPPLTKQVCLTSLPALPEEKTYPGKIVLLGLNLDNPQKPSIEASFFDFQTRQTTAATPENILPLSVSPDHTKYAAVDRNADLVKVFSMEGQLLKTIPKGKDGYIIDRWLDNEHIALVVAQPIENKEGSYYVDYLADTVIANPFTNEQITLPSHYPDIYAAADVGWDGGVITTYDPQLTRVVYAAYIENDYLGKKGKGYILWDLQKQVKLVQIVMGENVTTPKWVPDGSRFVINNAMGNGEFYSVTRDGKVTQITHLNPQGEVTGSYFSDIYSWSPDGQQLAFWREMYLNGSIQATFAVLKPATGEITDYCIQAGTIEPGVPRLDNFFTPIWSPDGKYVVISANRQEGENFETLLIDFEDGSAAKIVENLYPKGWLNNAHE